MSWQVLAKKLLCPPGNGVFTVNTAKERKEKLHQLLYPGSRDVVQSWQAQLDQLTLERPTLLGVCSDTGGGILRGANWGPLFLRLALKEEAPQLRYDDLGDVRVIPHLLHDKYLNDKTIKNCQKALYSTDQEDLPVSPLSITEEFLTQLYESHPNAKIMAFGGDHSVSYPLTRSFLRAKKRKGIKVGLLHFDAHTDLLVERLGIDLCFGSWCTHILEDLPTPEALVQVGIRSSGKDRGHWEKTFGVRQYWSDLIHREGAANIIEEIIEHYQALKIDELYISFDIDAIDAQYAGATGTPEVDGLRPDQAGLMIQEITKVFPLTGADMVEVAPFVQTTPGALEPETTLRTAGALTSLLIEAMSTR